MGLSQAQPTCVEAGAQLGRGEHAAVAERTRGLGAVSPGAAGRPAQRHHQHHVATRHVARHVPSIIFMDVITNIILLIGWKLCIQTWRGGAGGCEVDFVGGLFSKYFTIKLCICFKTFF